MKRATHFWQRLIVIATIALLVIPTSLALAARPGDKGPPPGKGEEAGSNNLSVPTIFVPNPGAFPVTCPGGPDDPIGDPSNGYEIAPLEYYYVQGENTWQAECTDAASGLGQADFGDNLTSGALKAGMPIRIEVGLMDTSGVEMIGYNVVKLQPSELDRNSAYGTHATPTVDGFVAEQTAFPWTGEVIDPETGLPTEVTVGVRIWDSTATFSIRNAETNEYVVPEQLFGAEINATGAVVYGYNWGVSGHGVKELPAAGTYILRFTSPAVTLTNSIAGDVHTAEQEFTLAPKNNGGGGGHGPNH